MEFLDLTDATDTEKKEIIEILFSSKALDAVELPIDLTFSSSIGKPTVAACQRRDYDDIQSSVPAATDGDRNEAEVLQDALVGLTGAAGPLPIQQQHVLNLHTTPMGGGHEGILPGVATNGRGLVGPFPPPFDAHNARMSMEGQFKVYPIPTHGMQPVMTSMSPMAGNGPTPASMSTSMNIVSPSAMTNAMVSNGQILEDNRLQQQQQPGHAGYPMSPMYIGPNGHFMSQHGPPFSAPSHMFPPFYHIPYFYMPQQQHMQAAGHHHQQPPHQQQQFNLGPEQIPMIDHQTSQDQGQLMTQTAPVDLVEASVLAGQDPSQQASEAPPLVEVNDNLQITAQHVQKKSVNITNQIITEHAIGTLHDSQEARSVVKKREVLEQTLEKTITFGDNVLATGGEQPKKQGSGSKADKRKNKEDEKNSAGRNAVAAKETVPSSSSNKSWASLFVTTSSDNGVGVASPSISFIAGDADFAVSSSNLSSSQAFPGLDEQQSEASLPQKPRSDSYGGTLQGLDAQVTSIPLHDDAMARKLGRKLQDIQLKHSLPYLAPRGFVNRGNWCYINATLQALLYCPPFYNLMREIGETQGIFRDQSSTPIIDSFARFFSNFLPSESLIRRAKSGGFNHEELPKQENYEPKCIYEVLGAIKSECLKGKQEDAEEFLSSVLNGLHEEMIALFKFANEGINGDILSNGHIDVEDNTEDDSALWKEVGPKHKALPTRSARVIGSPVMDIFGGSLLSVRTAGKDVCANRQPFFTLQLDIQADKIKSVEDAIRHLTTSETIQGFTCPKTNQVVDANYQPFVEQLPPILILHLKCFVYDKDGGSKKLVKKIEYPVDFEFPRESLHQDRNEKKDRFAKTYKLLSVVYHDGTESGKGHYVTDIFHIGRSQWLRCDDTSIKPVTSQQLLNPQLPRMPYLLFYRRVDTLRTVGGGGPSQGRASHNPH